MMEPKENRLKIKLPKEFIIHIPSFGEMTLEDFSEGRLFEQGMKRIEEMIKDKAVDKFVERHDKVIDELAEEFIKEHKEEWKEKLRKTIK